MGSLDVIIRDHDLASGMDGVRHLLGMPDNPTLFPGHFLKATFPKIGGRLADLRDGSGRRAVGFLFPRALHATGRAYTLRLHTVAGPLDASLDAVAQAVSRVIDAHVVGYDPTSPGLTFAPEMPPTPGLSVGQPSARDAASVRALQQAIWRPDSPDALYPSDLHAREFHCGTSLVARVDGEPVGFLFGFYTFGGSPLPGALAQRHPDGFRLESQVMGVLPAHRGAGLAATMKQHQATLARADGIHVINWTFDPLLFGNAALNFGRLGGFACDFHPHFYDFQNDRNRAPASRLSVTWLINARRVRRWVPQAPADLDAQPGTVRLNDGSQRRADARGADRIAIEVPEDWVAMQRDDTRRDEVLRWRQATDDLLGECVGTATGQYALTGVARDARRRCYLTGERLDEARLDLLGTHDHTDH